MSTLAAQAISTGTLDLLPFRIKHAEEMAAVLSDPALHTFTGGTPDTPQTLRSYSPATALRRIHVGIVDLERRIVDVHGLDRVDAVLVLEEAAEHLPVVVGGGRLEAEVFYPTPEPPDHASLSPASPREPSLQPS